MLENYCKSVCIEAQTMSDMGRRQILPAVEGYAASLASAAAGKAALGVSVEYEKKAVEKLSGLAVCIDASLDALDAAIAKLGVSADITDEANYIRDELLGRMDALRAVCDEAETVTAGDYWPFPTYGELLFGVR